MQSNVTNPVLLPRYVQSAFSFPSTGLTEAHTVVTRNGLPVANGTAGTLADGVAGNSADVAKNEYISLVDQGIAIVKVEAGASVAYNAPVSAANTGTGRVRTGVPGTDQIIGKALDVSDGSGTAQAPHYIRVQLYI